MLVALVATAERRRRRKRRGLERQLDELTLLNQKATDMLAKDYSAILSQDLDSRHQQVQATELNRAQIKLLQQIGRGQFGVVQLGSLLSSDYAKGLVAVKIISGSSLEDTKIRFFAEASMLHRLRHENIISLVGVCSQSYPLLLVMEYMEQGDLKSYLRHHQSAQPARQTAPDQPYAEFSLVELKGVMRQIASALDFLESLNVVHRDVAARYAFSRIH